MTKKSEFKSIHKFVKLLIVNTFNKLYKYRSKKLKVSDVIERTQRPGNKHLQKRKKNNKKSFGSYIIGTLYLNNYNKSYVEKDKEKYYVSKQHISTALNRDIVELYVSTAPQTKNDNNRVTKIVKRNKTSYVGTLKKDKDNYYITPDDNKIQKPIIIPTEYLKNASIGTKVIVKIKAWKAKHLIAEIKTILGQPGDNNVENRSILSEFGFSNKFPKKVEQLVNNLEETISRQEIQKRADYRNITTFTIDPIDAKDFDDAISIKILNDGNYQVGVHIADVSHFVQEDDLLDIEAQKRATSVYLVSEVIPMLPERLSNNLCSLRPNVDRLTFSVVFNITRDYKIKSYSIQKAIIHSNKRFTYEEVQEILENKQGLFYDELNILNNIAKYLRKKRISDGSINFNSQEVKFILDKDKKPIDIILKVQKDAHKLIEEFMLLANKTVAEAVSTNFFTSPRPFVYRAHEAPNKNDISKFGSFISTFGYKINTKNNDTTRHSINKLMEDIKTKDEEYLISQLAIRSMNKAYYSTKIKHHYGLAFSYYTHFTSPIRRYPDIMSHRLLNYYLNKQEPKNIDNYEGICQHSSIMEKKAVDAERASVKLKQIEYLEKNVGDTFNSIISGVTEWGIYVELIENGCEGMIGIKSLKNPELRLNEDKNALTDNKGTVLRIGDRLKVKLTRVDPIKKHIDFKLC